MKPIPRTVLATALVIGGAILIWHSRPSTPPTPVLQTNATPEGVTVERAAADPADTSTKDYTLVGQIPVAATYHYNPPTNAAPVIDHAHFPFTPIDDPWLNLDPGEVSVEDHERWLKEKRALVLREAGEGFAAREALWEQFKQQRGAEVR